MPVTSGASGSARASARWASSTRPPEPAGCRDRSRRLHAAGGPGPDPSAQAAHWTTGSPDPDQQMPRCCRIRNTPWEALQKLSSTTPARCAPDSRWLSGRLPGLERRRRLYVFAQVGCRWTEIARALALDNKKVIKDLQFQPENNQTDRHHQVAGPVMDQFVCRLARGQSKQDGGRGHPDDVG